MILTVIIGKNLINRVCVSALRPFETPNVNVLGAHMYMWYVCILCMICICSFHSDNLDNVCEVIACTVCALCVYLLIIAQCLSIYILLQVFVC